MIKMKGILLHISLILLSIIITIATTLYQRPSSEIVQFGTECTVERWMHCYSPRVSAGFPFAFGFDTPGISIQHSVTPLIEDEFRIVPFLVDIWFYYIFLLLTLKAFRR